MRRWRRLVCRHRGHLWDYPRQICTRCDRTAEEIALGAGDVDVDAEHREYEAYMRGVEDGQKMGRRRAYRLGYLRGGRDVFGRLEDWTAGKR